MKDRDLKPTHEELRVRKALLALGEVRADNAFRERLKRDFVSGAITETRAVVADRRPFRSPAWQFAFLTTVAVMTGIFLFTFRGPAWDLHAVLGEGRITVNGQTEDSRDAARVAARIEPASRIQVGGDADLDLIAGNVILLELDAGCDVTIPRTPRRWFPKPLESVLHAGEIRLKTGPGFSGRQLTVRTSEGLTVVSGTAVSVYKGDHFTCVCVLQGTARIGKDDARLEEVAGGLRKVMFSDGQPSVVTAIEPHHKEELLKFLERNKGVFD